MIELLILYCIFSMLFCVATVDETDYPTQRGTIAAIIFHFFAGPLLLPIILGDALRKMMKEIM